MPCQKSTMSCLNGLPTNGCRFRSMPVSLCFQYFSVLQHATNTLQTMLALAEEFADYLRGLSSASSLVERNGIRVGLLGHLSLRLTAMNRQIGIRRAATPFRVACTPIRIFLWQLRAPRRPNSWWLSAPKHRSTWSPTHEVIDVGQRVAAPPEKARPLLRQRQSPPRGLRTRGTPRS